MKTVQNTRLMTKMAAFAMVSKHALCSMMLQPVAWPVIAPKQMHFVNGIFPKVVMN